jgi:GAF domain-containing protein
MMAHGAVTGVFHVWRGVEKPPFTQADVDFLTNFANQAAVALENARLLDSAQRRLRQLTLLGEMTHAALEIQEPDALLRAMAEPMAGLIGADVCHLVLRDPEMPSEEAGLLRGTFARQPLPPATLEALEACAHFAGEEHLETTHQTELAGVADGGDSPLRSVLRLSLQAGDTHLGTASLGFVAPHPFSPEEISLCQQAAEQMALALAKAFALQSERRRSEELEAVHHANLRLTSQLELRPVLEAILEQVVRLVGADDAHIFLYDGKRLTFGAALWAGQPQREGFSTPRPHGLTYTVAHTRERIIVHDTDTHPLFEDYRWGGAIVGLPLFSGDRVTGVMTVAHIRPHIFQDRELRLIDLLADQAAVALENARLYERRAAEQKRIQLLFDVTQALSNSLDPLEILQRAVTLTTDSLGGLFGEGFLLERGTDRLRLRALAGLPHTTPADLDALLDMHLNKGLVGWIAANRESALVDDVAADSHWVFLRQQEEGVRSALGAPILAGDELLGVLMVFHKHVAAFDQGHLDVLVAIAQQVGLALSNAERYQQTRRRLAEQTALQQVGQVINRRLEMRPLLDEVVRQVREVLGYPMVEILLVEHEELVSRASDGWSQPGPPPRMRFTQGIVGRAVRTNQPAFAPDVRLDPDYIPTEPTTQSEIVVPLRKGGVVFGVLNVEASEVGSLTEDDLRLLTLLADQISVAIENAALYDHLRQHADQLERTVAERTSKLADALGQAQQADRVKSQFVSDVSHELRTPLSNIRLYLDLLRAGRPDRFEEYVDTLGRETDRLVRLIEDLLAISRLEAGASPMLITPLNLNALAESLVEDRRRLFAARGLQLEFTPQPDLPPVVADERMLSQVVANLLTNAMQYTASGSVMASTETRLKDGKPFSTLTIRDTGMGIPPDEIPRIFERFFRGSNSRRVRAPGTGLGLAICREILERHGGGISVESQVGKGSAFTIWLPADTQVQPSSDKISPEPISRTIRF